MNLPSGVLPRGPLETLRAQPLDASCKGIPLGTTTSLDEIGRHGWNVARGDLALPVLTLGRRAVASNLATMATYCARHGALLAPHGKTTMSPQLFDAQLAAGAWGITCATPTQAAVMRRFGVPRIVMANELTEPGALRWIAGELDRDPGFEFLCLVDSVGTVELMQQVLREAGARRPVQVLLEVGPAGGRGGVRDREAAFEVGAAVLAAPNLRLVGVEAFEGVVTGGDAPEDFATLDRFFALMRAIVVELAGKNLFETQQVLVSAGGSSYFDRVIAGLSGWDEVAQPVQLVLRSGCYLSHDSGKYRRLSPLDGRRAPGEDLRLVEGLTGWAAVLSTPEPGVVVLGGGKRDFSYDLSLPVPKAAHTAEGTTPFGETAEVVKMMDQHIFLRISAGAPALRPGDVVSLGISHPCTSFDKNRFIPIIDEDHTVVDGVITFF
ncbi:amino acid deaminase [Amycolatopsis ultiminotia]|uniref:Amino acid deaminase n=1 Tax=Amycolatopsis ultiminotia TaxID=543629 RepID=A0ABP6V3I4_9PSEU